MDISHLDKKVMAWRLILMPPKLIKDVARITTKFELASINGDNSTQPRVISIIPVKIALEMVVSIPKIEKGIVSIFNI